jgi:hypothetical protein
MADFERLAFPFCAPTVWIHIGFDKPDIAFYHWADVLYPVLRALLVFLNGTALEPEINKGQLDLARITIRQPIRGDIVLDHGFLVIVGGVLLCLDRVIEATSYVRKCALRVGIPQQELSPHATKGQRSRHT